MSASTRNQALNARVFPYNKVLERPPGDPGFRRARGPRRRPVVLSQSEVRRLRVELRGTQWLIGSLLYGTGMRLMESLRLRVQDLDLDRALITVRRGKRARDRIVPLPQFRVTALGQPPAAVWELHPRDCAEGFGETLLPDALARKYPNAAGEWRWQFVFRSGRLSVDPRSGATRRYHRGGEDRTVDSDHIVVDLAKLKPGERWLDDVVAKANNGGIERVLL